MVRSPLLQALLVVSSAAGMWVSSALAQGQALAPIVGYLESAQGVAKFEALVSAANAEKLAQLQNFLRFRGARDAEIAEAISTRNAGKLRAMVEEAVTRAASDPALQARVSRAAQDMIGVSNNELTAVAALKLRAGDGPAPVSQFAGRAAQIRGSKSGETLDFGTMPPGKFGPPIPDGPLANPVRPMAVAAFVAQLEELERGSGGLSAAARRALLNNPELVGPSAFDDCFGGRNGVLAEAPRHVLESIWASADGIARGNNAAIRRAGLEVEKQLTMRSDEEAVEAFDTLTQECAWLGKPYAAAASAVAGL